MEIKSNNNKYETTKTNIAFLKENCICFRFSFFDGEGRKRERERGEGRLYSSGGRERGRDEKLAKNQRKNYRKSTKNLPKMNQKSVLEGSRRALGGPWRPRSKKHQKNANFWGLLGPSWGRLGGLLGPSWRLDRRLGPSWAVLEPS